MPGFIRFAPAAAIALAAVLAAPPQAAAQQALSADELVQRLTPGKDARGTQLRTRGLRPVTEEPKAAEAAAPSVDLEIRFAFASAELTEEARQVLDQLGAALKDPRLESYRFKLVGHTDAVGSEAYNLALSAERAAAVRDYLKSRFGVSDDRLESIGMGEAQLRDPANPTSAVNRRVQVINVGTAR
ncbi:MAG: OmpA family protein [Rhodospirillales bacterium]|nr:OmpA family protein [Rhodospirillales bacterium]